MSWGYPSLLYSGVDVPGNCKIIAADLNGDKKLDIAATSDDGSRRVQGSLEMRWWRNEGREAK
ncbi:MAG: hypothetical protein WEB58_17180 [Planctomycetaceae bacterium]